MGRFLKRRIRLLRGRIILFENVLEFVSLWEGGRFSANYKGFRAIVYGKSLFFPGGLRPPDPPANAHAVLPRKRVRSSPPQIDHKSGEKASSKSIPVSG